MSTSDQERPATPLSASHLIERAAERLRLQGVASGMIDGSAASLLDCDPLFNDQAPRARIEDAAVAPTLMPSPRNRENDAPPERDVDPHLTPAGAGPSRRFAPQGEGSAALPRGGHGRPQPLDHATMVAAGMIDWSQVRSRLSEEFRVVQAQVLRQAFASDPELSSPRAGTGHGGREAGGEARQASNVLMITSARPREGKTFTSLNLAASIARQRDRDVLLVDMDNKRGSLSEKLGLNGRPGLMELAVDPRTDPQELITPTELSHLSVLGYGASDNGAELLASRQMARVLRNLGRRFADRLVILDSPPCLASSDASAVAPVVGQIILVIEAEQTQRAEVEAALDLIQSCPAITLLLNKIQMRARHMFGSYYPTYAYN